jgi:catechol 2,3-dioxygenase-like lactoylglutathione lyase family enzyme
MFMFSQSPLKFLALAPCLLALLVLLSPVSSAKAEPAPDYHSLDHVEFSVTDLQRSLQFYTKLFGNDLWKHKQGERRYLKLGTAYIALEQRNEAKVEHVCFGIDHFNITTMHSYLKAKNLAWQDYPSGRDLYVDDRDGNRAQLTQDNTWPQVISELGQRDVFAVSGDALFHPLHLDEVFVTVTNLEVDSLHYARLLGQTGKLQAGSLWFSLGSARLRLSQAPVGQTPGVNYFSVLVSHTDLDAAADAVFAAGGIIENILPNGFSFWDPDGLRVEVHVAEQILRTP